MGLQVMEHHKLIRPEHLNQFGYLFGGYMLMWVDEVSWITASVQEGTVLRFLVTQEKQGVTSISYLVTVSRGSLETGDLEEVFSTVVTFVRVDESGQKLALT
jgi:acyl-CoA hydrolase